MTYADSSFDQLIYLQQLVSLVGPAAGPSTDSRGGVSRAASRRAHGDQSVVHARSPAPLLADTRLAQTLAITVVCSLSLQNQPWLRLQNGPNPKALLDRGPYTYWFHESEAVELFQSADFVVEGIGSEVQIRCRPTSRPASRARRPAVPRTNVHGLQKAALSARSCADRGEGEFRRTLQYSPPRRPTSWCSIETCSIVVPVRSARRGSSPRSSTARRYTKRPELDG